MVSGNLIKIQYTYRIRIVYLRGFDHWNYDENDDHDDDDENES